MLVSGTIAAPGMRHRDLGIVEESDGPRCMKRRGVPGRTRLLPDFESSDESVNFAWREAFCAAEDVQMRRNRPGRSLSDPGEHRIVKRT
jgi:hypothetical protein